MFLLYSLLPIVMKLSSATTVNISLLTADLYALFAGLFLFNQQVICKRVLNLLVDVLIFLDCRGDVIIQSRPVLLTFFWHREIPAILLLMLSNLHP